MANLSELRTSFSEWWNDREFTKRQGRVHAVVFSAAAVSFTFGLAVLLSL